ncbi:(2Fe-2S)-binding protein [Streptomyces sp. WI04-05B]|uniref:(2Fe-2S)-binding protein n=1 Tax=Streptomyces TaxID=1883 RepID=UPI0029B626D0|nr:MULTISPECIES: (2Fe-2S)-binding protein [unclassified Streptomyces]MDX2545992.1 (2Fe-2S)-binding protein [Streptomyces sp. WI04-05B]MDX2582707.1 (2Fe-2S)-binding protein [Streptomyces sp. WI04-05A]MDX3746978.1 (2Fe-2S)-binding protein [Streptomyces sp. AK08-02]
MTVALEPPSAAAAARVLGDAYRRLADLCDVLTVQVAPADVVGPQVVLTGRELTTDQESLHSFVEAEATRIQERHGHTARPHVAASRALHDYAWSVGLLMSGVWYLERRVPRVRPEDVRLDLSTGVYKITSGSSLSCLPGDPAATLPGVTVLPHEEALRTELRSAVADHMAPLLTALGPIARRGSRALWGLVSDDLVSGIWYLGRMLGREDDAVRAATELLPSAVSPYPGGADFRHLTDSSGRRHPTRTRTGCCLYYTIRPDDACSTCPRTCDTERLRRLES